MMLRRMTWTLGILAVALVPSAWCQERSAAPAAQETVRLADQITVLRAINPLQLTEAQIRELLNILKPAMQKMEKTDPATVRQLAVVVPQLRQAVGQVAVTPGQTAPAELEYVRLQQVERQSRERVRDQLRRDLRAALDRILAPAQKTAVVSGGHQISLQRGLQEWQAANQGPIERVARSLDELRQADPRRFAEQRQQFAYRQAEVPDFWRFMRQDGGGGDRGRGGVRGRGGDRGQRNAPAPAPPPALNDPAVQARVRQYQMLADQVRRMPEATYRQQREKLAIQLWQSREQQQAQTRPEQDIDEFITRILATPAAVQVLEAKIAKSVG